MMLGLNTAITGSGGIATLADYALEFNGTDEYLQIALPNNELLASAGVTDFYSSGSAIAGWTEIGGTVDWAGATAGKTYTNTIIIPPESGISKKIPDLVIGQKYKLKIRYQCDGELLINNGINAYFTLPVSVGEWNTVSKIFTAISTLLYIEFDGGGILDYASVKHEQGFDLNKDQEQILHSRNANFNNAGTDWSAHGNHSLALSSGILQITASGAGDATTNYIELPPEFIESCLRDKKYTIEGLGRSNTATTTLTFKLGSKSVTSGNLTTTGGAFTNAVLNLLATASEEGVPLIAYLNKAAVVDLENVSLTQKYDRVIIKKFKANSVATKTLVVMDSVNYIETRDTGKLRFNIGDDNSTQIFDTTQVSYSASEWTNVIFLSDSTDKMYVVKNGVLPAGLSITTLGKEVTRTHFRIGANTIGRELFAGQISHIQIWKFENIALSTFNPALTGLQYPTGGGAEEVLRLTFQSGLNITECLKDYSPKAHTVSGVNVDITNRKKVTA